MAAGWSLQLWPPLATRKVYREAKKNSLVIFTFKVVEGNSGCILNLFRKPYSMNFRWSFRQLASKLAHPKQRVALDPVLFFRSVCDTLGRVEYLHQGLVLERNRLKPKTKNVTHATLQIL